jgi:SAM-dependent methyltransferase
MSLRAIKDAISKSKKRIRYRGRDHFCPLCESDLKTFLPYGVNPRPNAQCGVCGAVERHRTIWLYLRSRTDLFDQQRRKRVLHVAPERQIRNIFQSLPHIDYLSVDLDKRSAMQQMDITDIPLMENSFDVIYCSHVLEHIPDDRKAMSELHRVLSPRGWAILQVPLRGEKTQEDPNATTPEDRLRLYGQEDHVRIYGRDYKDRLEEAGFRVTLDDFAKSLDDKEKHRLSLCGEDIYFCRKAA